MNVLEFIGNLLGYMFQALVDGYSGQYHFSQKPRISLPYIIKTILKLLLLTLIAGYVYTALFT